MYGPDQSKNCGSSPSSWSYLSPRRSYSGQQPIWVAHRQANATLPGSKAAALPGFKLWVHRFRPIGGQPANSGSVDRRKQRYHTLMPAASRAGRPARSGAARAAAQHRWRWWRSESRALFFGRLFKYEKGARVGDFPPEPDMTRAAMHGTAHRRHQSSLPWTWNMPPVRRSPGVPRAHQLRAHARMRPRA